MGKKTTHFNGWMNCPLALYEKKLSSIEQNLIRKPSKKLKGGLDFVVDYTIIVLIKELPLTEQRINQFLAMTKLNNFHN